MRAAGRPRPRQACCSGSGWPRSSLPPSAQACRSAYASRPAGPGSIAPPAPRALTPHLTHECRGRRARLACTQRVPAGGLTVTAVHAGDARSQGRPDCSDRRGVLRRTIRGRAGAVRVEPLVDDERAHSRSRRHRRWSVAGDLGGRRRPPAAGKPPAWPAAGLRGYREDYNGVRGLAGAARRSTAGTAARPMIACCHAPPKSARCSGALLLRLDPPRLFRAHTNRNGERLPSGPTRAAP